MMNVVLQLCWDIDPIAIVFFIAAAIAILLENDQYYIRK